MPEDCIVSIDVTTQTYVVDVTVAPFITECNVVPVPLLAALDVVEVGPQGPPGVQGLPGVNGKDGDPGAAGLPGPGIESAAATVNFLGQIVTAHNVRAVARPATGIYCVTINPAAVLTDNSVVVASIEFATPDFGALVQWDRAHPDCLQPSQIELRTFQSDSTAANETFSFILL